MWLANNSVLKNVLIRRPCINGNRPRGRRHQRWQDRVWEDLETVDRTAKLENVMDRGNGKN